MGGFLSKSKKRNKRDVVKVQLSYAQRRRIILMFEMAPGEELEITWSMLMKLWMNRISDGTLRPIVEHLFKQKERIRIEDLELFYYMMIEGTTNDRAKLLVDVLGKEGKIAERCFKIYMSCVIRDYIHLLEDIPGFLSLWTIDWRGIQFNSDVKIVTEFILRDLSVTDEKVGVNEVEEWLQNSVFMSDILNSLFKYVFNMELKELRPMLPVVNMPSSILSVPLALLLANVIDARMTKGWRLLYSPQVNAHSWSIFCRSIIKQGPSIVLIEHRDGQLFGGYASQSWKLRPAFYGDENSFLFQLRPHVQVFSPTGYNKNFQYFNSGAFTLPNGLAMGGNINYFTMFLSPNLGPAYVAKSSSTFRGYAPSTAYNEFIFKKLEIWATGDPDQEEPDRREGLIMDRDPLTAAILELVGTTVYSQHLRNEEDQ